MSSITLTEDELLKEMKQRAASVTKRKKSKSPERNVRRK